MLRSLLNIIDVFINPKGKGETMEGDRPVQLQLGQHWTFCIRRYRIFAEYYLQYKKGNNLSGSRMKCLVGKSESSMSVRVQNLLQKRLLVYRAFRTDCHVLRRRWRGRKRKIINPNIAAATAWSRYHSRTLQKPNSLPFPRSCLDPRTSPHNTHRCRLRRLLIHFLKLLTFFRGAEKSVNQWSKLQPFLYFLRFSRRSIRTKQQ